MRDGEVGKERGRGGERERDVERVWWGGAVTLLCGLI